MISRSLKDASRARYEDDTVSHFISVDAMRAAGMMDRAPEEADFVTLQPGDSYSVEAEYGIEPANRKPGKRAVHVERFMQIKRNLSTNVVHS
jgi:hypothetical protein